MSFVSFEFLLLVAVTVLIYYLLPHRFRWIWLLAASFFFYLSYDPRYAIFLAVSILTTYASGLLIAKSETAGRKKLWVVLCLLVNVGILLTLKYLNFFSSIAAGIVFGSGGAAPKFNLLLPAGISFYTFQSLSYTIDVYRGDAEPERHLGKYALFVSFFPTLLSGPIQKAKEGLKRFDEEHFFDYDEARRGCLLVLFGYFEKTVVADRLCIPVNTVYADPSKYHGLASLIAVLFYSLQIYCDFAGYSNIAIGVSELLGFRLARNFDRPYFAGSVREFWRRWHISLSSWLRDYLYFPLGGSRCSMPRQCLNVMIVFVVCGLWHGASLTFLVWGALHGLYQVVGRLTKEPRRKLCEKLRIDAASGLWHAARVAFTFLLVTFAWIFFRAASLPDAFTVIGSLFRFDPAAFANPASLGLGMTGADLAVALIGLLLVWLADVLRKKGDPRDFILKKKTAVRWSFYVTAALVLLFLGQYGPISGAQSFIY